MDIKRQYADDLLSFLNSAPTPFQSVDALEKMLVAAGAEELCEGDAWNIEKGKLYYMKKRGTQLAAFKIGAEEIGKQVLMEMIAQGAIQGAAKSANIDMKLGITKVIMATMTPTATINTIIGYIVAFLIMALSFASFSN